MSSLLEQFEVSLRDFYETNRIAVSNFSCKHLEKCEAASSPRPLHNGAEGHIGSQYGSVLRLVIVSLDTGHESNNLEERRKRVESVTEEGINPHMRGTTTLVQKILGDVVPENSNIHQYYSMVNSAKCSGADDKQDMVNDELYSNCLEYTMREIELLKPQLLVTQGVKAAKVLRHFPLNEVFSVTEVFKEMGIGESAQNWLCSVVNEYIRAVQLNSGEYVPILQTPHPAARSGQWQLFERISLAPLVCFIKKLIELRDEQQLVKPENPT